MRFSSCRSTYLLSLSRLSLSLRHKTSAFTIDWHTSVNWCWSLLCNLANSVLLNLLWLRRPNPSPSPWRHRLSPVSQAILSEQKTTLVDHRETSLIPFPCQLSCLILSSSEFSMFLLLNNRIATFHVLIQLFYASPLIEKALSAKHRNNRPPPSHEVEITEAEPSRTPEDSVCSIEGPTDTNTNTNTNTGGEASGFSASK